MASAVLALVEKVEHDLKLSGVAINGRVDDAPFPSLSAMWRAELGVIGHKRKAEEENSGEESGEGAASGSGDGGDGGASRTGTTNAAQAATNASAPSGSAWRWYSKCLDFWDDEQLCPSDVNGVLGGYGHISAADLKGSAGFLEELWRLRPALGRARAADCGAGIGRVARGLLLPRFDAVDLVEQSPRLLEAAPKFVGTEWHRATCLCMGIQDFSPLPETYDLIWCQWVIAHLHDADIAAFIRRCRRALRPGGVLVFKENCCATGKEPPAFAVDREDCSVARSLPYLRSLIGHAGAAVVHQAEQPDFPNELFPVYMIALA